MIPMLTIGLRALVALGSIVSYLQGAQLGLPPSAPDAITRFAKTAGYAVELAECVRARLDGASSASAKTEAGSPRDEGTRRTEGTRRAVDRAPAARAQSGDSSAQAPPPSPPPAKPGGGESDSTSAPVPTRRSSSQQVSFSGMQIVIPAGEYHDGDLVSIGGRITVRGEVRGDVVCIGGRVIIDGTVDRDLIIVGGVGTISGRVRGQNVSVASRVSLGDHGRIDGQCINVAGSLDRPDESSIGGQFISIGFPNLGWFATGHGPFRFLMLLLFWVAFVGTAIRFLGVLVVSAIGASRIEGALARPRPPWILAFFLGLAVRLFSTLLLIVLAALCVTLPIALALWLGLRVAMWMGLASIYLELGSRVGRTLFGKELSYFASILLGFFLFAILGFIPIFGWILTGILSTTALGLMLLTRFGGKKRTLNAVAAPASTAGRPGQPGFSAS